MAAPTAHVERSKPMCSVRGWGCLSTAPIIMSPRPERQALAGGCNHVTGAAQPGKTECTRRAAAAVCRPGGLNLHEEKRGWGGGDLETSARQPPQNRPLARTPYLTKPVEGANLGRACSACGRCPNTRLPY